MHPAPPRLPSCRLICAVIALAPASLADPPGTAEPGPAPPFSIREEAGVSWLVSPSERRFFSFGVCCVDGGSSRENYQSDNPSYASWRHYPDTAAWAEASLERLRSWGFTTVGGWSDYGTLLRSSRMLPAFTPVIHCGSTAGVPWFNQWDEQVIRHVEETARAKVVPVRDDPRLLGYYSDNEIGWWNGELVRMTFEQPPSNGQRRRLLDLLREEYRGDWTAVERDFDPQGAGSFEDLDRGGRLFLRPGGGGMRVLRLFLGLVARRYYEITRDAIRACDRRGLLLGDRYQSFYYPEVARAAAPFVDLVSTNLNAGWNDGTFPRYYLATLQALTGKPLIIGEFYMAAAENRTGDKNDSALFPVTRTQAERARGFRTTLEALARESGVVGADWFQYYDEPPKGRYDGEDFDFGLVDVDDRPYQELTAAAAALDPTALHGRPAPPRPDAGLGVPPAPSEPLGRFEPMLALRDWDRERGFVRPSSEYPLADLYLSWTPEALYLGLYAQDSAEEVYYRDRKVPEEDRMEWTIRLGGSEEEIRVRLGAGRAPSAHPAGLRAMAAPGPVAGIRVVAAVEAPVSLLGRARLSKGDTIVISSTVLAHCRAYRTEWKGTFELRD